MEVLGWKYQKLADTAAGAFKLQIYAIIFREDGEEQVQFYGGTQTVAAAEQEHGLRNHEIRARGETNDHSVVLDTSVTWSQNKWLVSDTSKSGRSLIIFWYLEYLGHKSIIDINDHNSRRYLLVKMSFRWLGWEIL